MFNSEFGEVLTDLLASHNNKRLIVVGDFNIQVDNSNSSDVKAFNDILRDLDCVQHINCKTHEAGHTIDLCITPTTTALNLTLPKADFYLSDHALIEFHVSLPKPPLIKKLIKSRSLRKINTQNLQNDLISFTEEIISYKGDNIASEYNDKLCSILDRHAPVITKLAIPFGHSHFFAGAAKLSRDFVLPFFILSETSS